MTKDLIYAIASGKSQDAEAAFNSIVSEKIMAAIALKKQELAASMFAEPQVASEEVQIDEGVHTYDIEQVLMHHNNLHTDWRRKQPGHGKESFELEDHIKNEHGEKALKHIQAHTKMGQDHANEEDKRMQPLSTNEYKKKYGEPMKALRDQAFTASHVHQIKKQSK